MPMMIFRQLFGLMLSYRHSNLAALQELGLRTQRSIGVGSGHRGPTAHDGTDVTDWSTSALSELHYGMET